MAVSSNVKDSLTAANIPVDGVPVAAAGAAITAGQAFRNTFCLGKSDGSATYADPDGAGNLQVNLKTALPAGANLIGSVSVATALPAGANTIGGVTLAAALPTGANTIGGVTVASALPTGANTIGSVNVAAALPSGGNTIGSVNFAAALPAGANSIGQVTAHTVSARIIYAPTITGAAFASGNCVGGLLVFTNAFGAATTGVLQSISIAIASTQTAGFKFYLFASQPTTSPVDHATYSISTGDAAKVLGCYVFPASSGDSGLGANLTIYNLDGIGAQVDSATTSLFGMLTVQGTPTMAVGSLTVSVGVLQD